IAFLGPLGTYSHQATHGVLGDQTDYLPCSTIRDAFGALKSTSHAIVVPQENSTFGPVAETYDQLRRGELGSEWTIVGETVLSIQHCLFVRSGTKLEEVKEALSHEQALGQCNNFLTTRMPSAARIKTTSTSAAVKLISSDEKYRYSAAIGPEVCGTLFLGIDLLHIGIQDEDENFTKFFVIAKNTPSNLQTILPLISNRQPIPDRGLIRFSPALPSRTSSSPTITQVSARSSYTPLLPYLNAFASSVTLCRLDRRASTAGKMPFHDTYFAYVERLDGVLTDAIRWSETLKQVQSRIQALGGDATVLGFW
ncbi:Prephenate dehydratase-domain-containing protein, partial [Pterulicium gracile]